MTLLDNVPIASLVDQFRIGLSVNGKLELVKIADPVEIVNGSGADITTSYAQGKRVFIVNSPEGEFIMGNYPTGINSNKEIWIKNNNPNDVLLVTSYPNPMDNLNNLILAPKTTVHLIWSTDTEEWFILGKYVA